MDIDANDLLSTNVYIQKPELNPNVSLDSNEEFRRYYEKEIQKKADSKIIESINKIELRQEDDDNNIINTNRFNRESVLDNKSISRFIRETRTLVSIDSRDRIKTLFPKPNNFKIFLGRTFSNVKKIEMVSLEFPNTDAVINIGNNRIYWRNIEDIATDKTVDINGITEYPVYYVELRTGSYTSTTLQNEIQNKLNDVKRRNASNDYHYFVSRLDVDTDIVTFTSLDLKQLPNNPFQTSLGSGVILVTCNNHGFSTNDFIYIVGSKAIAGITSNILNGFQKIIRIDSSKFTFEVNVQAAETVSAGGNVVKAGVKLPFQLLWGENNMTIAQNIGFPLENSSQLINTNVYRLDNIVQMDIDLNYAHAFNYTYDYIGKNASVGELSGGTFIQLGQYQITNLPGTTKVRVLVNNETVITNLINNASANYFKFGNKLIPIASYSKYGIQSFLVTTYTNHNYNLKDINTNITLSNTTDPSISNNQSYDGTYSIQSIPNSTTFILPGIIGAQNIHTTNIYGTLARKTPLTTWTTTISDVKIIDIPTISGMNTTIKKYTQITTSQPHKMISGNQIIINNLKCTPQIKSEITIKSVPTSNTFLIDVLLSNIDLQDSINPYISTGLITVSFPSHNFNTIVNIQNGPIYNMIDGSGVTVPIQSILITTLNNHNLNVNGVVRLTGTGQTTVIDSVTHQSITTGVSPSLDGGGYIVKAINTNDTFTLVKVAGTSSSFTTITPSPIIRGIIGLDNDFYLYDVEDVGGISKTMLNNIRFSIRDIIDENLFTFIAPNVYAITSETGGGSNIYITSLKHGFNGIQTNTKNGILSRSINLQGEDYCFISCPQLDTMINTGGVKNIFSRISLDQPPGYVCFKYLSNPKHFNTMPLDKLSDLDFSVVNYNSSLYDFNDLDFSFTLQITEVSDATKAFNVSSKRGVTDTS
jgi:hypothetical protein